MRNTITAATVQTRAASYFAGHTVTVTRVVNAYSVDVDGLCAAYGPLRQLMDRFASGTVSWPAGHPLAVAL